MNLSPEIWGPAYWTTLHFISSTYDTNPNASIKENMKRFIQSIPTLLPCQECRDHAFTFLRSANIEHAVSNRQSLFVFFFNFHNTVNQRLKKPPMNIKDALYKYKIPKEEHNLYLKDTQPPHDEAARGKAASTQNLTIIIVLVALLALLVLQH